LTSGEDQFIALVFVFIIGVLVVMLIQPARIAQAIGALRHEAGGIESETNEDTYVPPDLIRNHPGIAKGYQKRRWLRRSPHCPLKPDRLLMLRLGRTGMCRW
jgi:hypothetical protein